MKTLSKNIPDTALDVIFDFPLKAKKEHIKLFEELMKNGISKKDFETVSISMSALAYLKYKTGDKNSYRAYALLNDAKSSPGRPAMPQNMGE